eukprot:6395564-Pyramimonas_sp.AAC.1
MLAGPKGREAGESGELDTGSEKGKVPWGVECTLAVTGTTGGPVKPSRIIRGRTPGGVCTGASAQGLLKRP